MDIDASFGEGGGQVLRSSLALALFTQRAIRLRNIRSRRVKPGLQPQHLTCVLAAQQVGQANVEGAKVGSVELVFEPSGVFPGEYQFDIGTAGSTSLVLQTVLPPLMCASAPSSVTFTGGTHNPLAPTYDFLASAYLPLINRMGPRVTARLERIGFYPRGGGRLHVEIQPAARLAGLELLERGPLVRRRAVALVARLPTHIADRELHVVGRELGFDADELQVEEVSDSLSPGNALSITFEAEQLTAVFTAIGRHGVPAEAVAAQATEQAQRWLDAGVPVDDHMADQLILPLAMAGSSSFRTLALSGHTTTHIDLVQRFLEVRIDVIDEGPDHVHVAVGAANL